MIENSQREYFIATIKDDGAGKKKIVYRKKFRVDCISDPGVNGTHYCLADILS